MIKYTFKKKRETWINQSANAIFFIFDCFGKMWCKYDKRWKLCCRCVVKSLSSNTHTHTQPASVAPPPVHLRLIIQSEDEVGQQLEEVLPQQQSHVKVNVAYVRLAEFSGEAHLAHADKLVDEVATVASVQTGIGLALIHLLLTPVRNQQSRSGQSATRVSGMLELLRFRRRRLSVLLTVSTERLRERWLQMTLFS